MIALSAAVRLEHAQAIGRMATGGAFLLMAGTQPLHPDGRADPELVLCRVEVREADVKVGPGGKVAIGPLDGRIGRDGVARWFRLQGADGTPVLDGSVGRTGMEADLTLSRTDLLERDVFELESLEIVAEA